MADKGRYSWTGFYAGLHAGGAWGDSGDSFPDIPGTLSGSADLSGAIGGVQAGYNWQTGSTVFGVEVSYSALNMDGGGECFVAAAGIGCNRTVENLGQALGKNVTARIEYRHIDLGDENYASALAGPFPQKVDLSIDVVQVGLNVKF